MDTSIVRLVSAAPSDLLRLAAAVEDWPKLLPHYRWVRILADLGHGQRVVEMAARRDVCPGLSVPLHWTARQNIQTDRVEFTHIAGLSKGMQVAWTVEPAAAGRI